MSKSKIVVLCHGCFDVLHSGHIYHLKKAKALGNYLIVSITHENYAKKPLRFPAEFRKEMLESLNFVDEVLITHDRTAVSTIKELKPNFYVKGKEYEELSLDMSGDIYLEKEAVESHGGQLAFTDDEVTFSATKVKEQSETFVDLSKWNFKLQDLLKFIHDVSHLKVCVIGETIIDRWTPVQTEGISSKSSCPTALIMEPIENQLGGAYVVARHLQDFVAQVDLITNDFRDTIAQPIEEKINTYFYTRGSIIKERFYHPALNTKIFELKTNTLHTVYQKQHDFSQYDILIVADFGHGMLNRDTARKISHIDDTFISVMAQTNSSNMGFNRIDKYPKANTYCLDKVELRLCLNQNENIDLALQLAELKNYLDFDQIFVTLGSQGSGLYRSQDLTVFPALVKKVVDPIGAGDAFLSLASLVSYLDYPIELSLLIPSLASAMNTQWLCNEKSITRAGFIEIAKKVI